MTSVRQSYVGGKEWFAKSGLSDYADDSQADPFAYARRLTRYISDASTVRVRTLEQFGKAPSKDRIRAMRAEWAEMVKRRAAEQDEFDRDPIAADAVVFQVAAAPVPAPAVVIEPESAGSEPPAPRAVAARHHKLRSIPEVIKACANICNVETADLIGTQRFRPIIQARNLCCAILRARGSSLANIGRYLNGRDHTTVMHNFRVFFDRDIKDERLLAAWVELAPCVLKAARTWQEVVAMAGHRI